MQELDRFGGVAIMTTNLFTKYDEAILRRVARHIEFALPNAALRERIFSMEAEPPGTKARRRSIAQALCD